MIYILVLIAIFYGVLTYDIRQKNDTKSSYYHFIMIVLILISGLGYRMGGDGMAYMFEYPQYNVKEGFSWAALNSYPGRQPAWVLLCKICRSFTEEYWLFKLVHAILVNCMVFYGLKRLTSYRFTAILFYFVLIYFEINFQVLRQAMAVGLFLVAIQYMRDNKWIKYYLLVALAIAFHETALVCIAFPLIKFIRIDKSGLMLIAGISLIAILFSSNILDSIINIDLPEEYADKWSYYTNDIDTSSTFSSYLNVLLSFVIPTVYIFFRKTNHGDVLVEKGALMYGLLYILGLYFPIIYRINLYFIFFFYLAYIDLIYDLSKYGLSLFESNVRKIKSITLSGTKALTYVTLIIVFLGIKSRFYFSEYGDTGMPAWVQYYPYTSVIFKDIDKTREEFIHRL